MHHLVIGASGQVGGYLITVALIRTDYPVPGTYFRNVQLDLIFLDISYGR
jgi:hypothetical protein